MRPINIAAYCSRFFVGLAVIVVLELLGVRGTLWIPLTGTFCGVILSFAAIRHMGYHFGDYIKISLMTLRVLICFLAFLSFVISAQGRWTSSLTNNRGADSREAETVSELVLNASLRAAGSEKAWRVLSGSWDKVSEHLFGENYLEYEKDASMVRRDSEEPSSHVPAIGAAFAVVFLTFIKSATLWWTAMFSMWKLMLLAAFADTVRMLIENRNRKGRDIWQKS